MKTLVVSNQKGGVGKSAIVTQLGMYAVEKRNLRVLVIDSDQQGNSSKPLLKSGLVTAGKPFSEYLLNKGTPVPHADFVLLPGDAQLGKLEKNAAMHNTIATNFRHLLASVDNDFDLCIVDTNPFPDIRLTAALVSAQYVLSPIQLNQEAIDGIAKLRADIANVQATLNPKLKMIGLLPNLVLPTPFQKNNLKDLAQHFSNLLMKTPTGFAHVKERTAIAEAQSAGMPLYKIPKTSAREAYKELTEVFDHVLTAMEVK